MDSIKRKNLLLGMRQVNSRLLQMNERLQMKRVVRGKKRRRVCKLVHRRKSSSQNNKWR